MMNPSTSKRLLFLLLFLTGSLPALVTAQTADDLRGGWISDEGGVRTVLVLVIDGSRVSGTYCAVDCANPDNLAFIDRGLLAEGRLSFDIWHDSGNGSIEVTEVEAALAGEVLELRFLSDPFAESSLRFVRSPRDTRPAAPSGGFGGPANTYIPPGPADSLSPEKVTGLWVSGIGPGKQYFIFKQHRHGLRGMVCGPCEDVSGMAPLENISISDTVLHFDIVHENSGPGIVEYGPHSNITDATISEDELHLVTVPSFADENYALIHMTLLGPVDYRP